MTESGHAGSSRPVQRAGWGRELRDAVSVRTASMILGVLLLQLGFVLSYVGAFHAPAPHRINVVVVAPTTESARIVSSLNGIASQPLRASAVGDEAAARARVSDGDASAALIVNPVASTDTLVIASGGGAFVAQAATAVLTEAERTQNRRVQVDDVVPIQPGDGRGLTSFYLMVGWIVGGYLVAAILGVARGTRPATPRRAAIRLAATAIYAAVSGIGGALIVGPLLGALTGHVFALFWIGTLIVMAAAATTMAFQELFGVLGIGLAILLFVVLGNPSAGGAYQAAALPPFWRSLNPALPNGAGTDTVRRVVYFGAHGITQHLLVISAYIVAGAAIAVIGPALRQRRGRSPIKTTS